MNRRSGVVLGILVVIVIIVAGVYLFGQSVDTEDPQQSDNKNVDTQPFPVLVGKNLLLADETVPTTLDGKYKLIVVSYDDDQQPIVNDWLQPLTDLNADYHDLRGYYVPLLPKSAADSALFILGGMGLAADNDEDRQRTIVVFTDVDLFNDLLDIENKEDVRLFLLDEENNVVWQTAGAYNAATIEDLRGVLEGLGR